MDRFFQFVQAHITIISLIASWLFSAAMSTMPDLPEHATFLQTWVYKFLQAAAANFQKHSNPSGIAGTDKTVPKNV
jgi:antirestriction protein ArdC